MITIPVHAHRPVPAHARLLFQSQNNADVGEDFVGQSCADMARSQTARAPGDKDTTVNDLGAFSLLLSLFRSKPHIRSLNLIATAAGIELRCNTRDE
jgi:hypothetical protein